MEQQLQFEEVKKILSWREMRPGVYNYQGIKYRWTNDYDRPISVITLQKDGLKMMYYAPSSFYWGRGIGVGDQKKVS